MNFLGVSLVTNSLYLTDKKGEANMIDILGKLKSIQILQLKGEITYCSRKISDRKDRRRICNTNESKTR